MGGFSHDASLGLALSQFSELVLSHVRVSLPCQTPIDLLLYDLQSVLFRQLVKITTTGQIPSPRVHLHHIDLSLLHPRPHPFRAIEALELRRVCS